MKKSVFALAASLFSAALFAYNPPAGGQSIFNISSPTQLTSASSAAGGGIFYPGPDSIAFNPALPSFEERVQLDADFSVLANKGEGGSGAAFQTGILIPMKMFNFSGLLNGVFLGADDMELENSLNVKAGFSKEITERLSVGLNFDSGYLWGNGSDWSLGAGLGALYRRESLGALKDFRVGASLLNLGKYYNAKKITGIDESSNSTVFPSFVTLKTGVGANFLQNDSLVLGGSFDITTQCFQNVVFDLGLQLGIKNLVFINLAERIDVSECAYGSPDLLPAVGVSVKFNLNAKNNSYLAAHNWEKSEMLASAAWQQKYENIEVVSAGLRIKLGQKDVEPPVIKIWDEE